MNHYVAHSLTDKDLEDLQNSLISSVMGQPVLPSDFDLARAATDWQLEQVIEWVSKFGWYLFEHPWQKHEFISELKKAMRPIQHPVLHPERGEENN